MTNARMSHPVNLLQPCRYVLFTHPLQPHAEHTLSTSSIVPSARGEGSTTTTVDERPAVTRHHLHVRAPVAAITYHKGQHLYMGPAVSISSALTRLMSKHRAASVVVCPVIHAFANLSPRWLPPPPTS